MKWLHLLSVVSLLVSLSHAEAKGLRILFRGDCSNASYDEQEGDIEFLNLNLDLDREAFLQQKNCEISISVPEKDGYYISVDDFRIEGIANIEQRVGFASISVQQRFKKWGPESRDKTIRSRSLVVALPYVGQSSCSNPVNFSTRIKVKGVRSQFFQDAAQATVSKISYHYHRC